MKGAYLLVIEVSKPIKLKIGKLGVKEFPKGIYIYVGSAMNNLEKRIERHMRKNKKLFWHIDYLLSDSNVKIKEVYVKESEKKEECEIAKIISKLGTPVLGFGSSDCKCNAHLFKLSANKLKEFARKNFK